MVVLGVLLVLGGLAAFGFGAPVFALSLIVGGVILVVAAGFEVMRYRSQAAEASRGKPGPGGGEPERPEARFRPTDEVFVDPTTKQRMRVYCRQLDRRAEVRRRGLARGRAASSSGAQWNQHH